MDEIFHQIIGKCLGDEKSFYRFLFSGIDNPFYSVHLFGTLQEIQSESVHFRSMVIDLY